MLELLTDPTIWAGLMALITLEVVLGIDNLIFIAILADKLPPHQRDRARQIGLGLALIMRLLLLASISWVMGLTQEVIAFGNISLSIRDIILLFGGLFLLFKATGELHERMEGSTDLSTGKPRMYADFWGVIAQIVALDAVFSIDSVITAIGMTEHLPVMMLAVTIAVMVMLIASKPLTNFVNKHPTIVILCLGFLMMIGLTLVAEAFDYHIPKGYLYAAIGFSVGVEAVNQITLARSNRRYRGLSLRERTAAAVLGMVGGGTKAEDPILPSQNDEGTPPTPPAIDETQEIFTDIERDMMRGVLKLGERTVKSIMTTRHDIEWLDINLPLADIRRIITATGYSQYPVCDGDLNNILGIVRTKDIVSLEEGAAFNLGDYLNQPMVAPEGVSVLKLLDQFRNDPVKCALVLDEYGSVEGIVTVTDILSAIAGEFGRGDDDDIHAPKRQPDGSWLMDGLTDIHRVQDTLELFNMRESGADFVTLAGFLLWKMRKIPSVGDHIQYEGWDFTVLDLEDQRITNVQITRVLDQDNESE